MTQQPSIYTDGELIYRAAAELNKLRSRVNRVQDSLDDVQLPSSVRAHLADAMRSIGEARCILKLENITRTRKP